MSLEKFPPLVVPAIRAMAPRHIFKNCANCGDEFRIPVSRDWREHCCSSDCKTELREQAKTASKAARTRQCGICGTAFIARQTQIDAGKGLYCSTACTRKSPKFAERCYGAEASRKKSDSMKQAISSGRVLPASGERHAQWKGGVQASKDRNKGNRASINRRYRQANPTKVREWVRKRRGKYLKRLPSGTIQRIFDLQRGCCAICQCKLTKGFHKDHIMPLARGGAHEPSNIQLLCGPCNVRKSAKDPIAYMQSLGKLL